MTKSVTHTRSYPTYIITQEPRQTPRKKGPFYSNKMVEDFLREAYRIYPEIICIVVTDPLDNGWYPEHGYEWLDMNGDRRKRHPREDRPSSPAPQTKMVGKPVAWRVHDMMVPRAHSQSQPSNIPDEALYPASREKDAREYARIMRGECEPLYAISAPPESHVAGAIDAIATVRANGVRIEREANALQDVGASLEAKIRIKVCDEITALIGTPSPSPREVGNADQR